MKATVRSIEYFYTTVKQSASEASRLLSEIAAAGVNLLAFSAIPFGPEHTQLVLFPDNVEKLARAAENLGLVLVGPEKAFLVQGDDRLGAIAEIYGKLAEADVEVYASTGVTDGRGGFGYVIYVRPLGFERAAHALGVVTS